MAKTKKEVIHKYKFSDPSFNILMQKRIRRVLIICSNYDAFMLEEDGRIDEQIFNEYASQSLKYPPVFFQADSAKKAFEILTSEPIDLVIEMLNIGDVEPFELANKIKKSFPKIPIVVLTHFSREVSLKLQNEDLSAIEYVFCWLGNADLLLAIIKLLEDKMNVEHDVKEVGVQTILFVEDSIRYISSYLPNIYKVLFEQSREFGKEALNEHQKTLRMRGRPKILLASSYEEAIDLYEKYKANLLGVISDISFTNQGKKDDKSGIKLLKKVRGDDQFLPFLLQTSNISFQKEAKKYNIGFIYKYSKTLLKELRDYIRTQFAFGDFVFREPKSLQEVARASNLMEFQVKLEEIPDEILKYHTNRNDISKWLNARALFPIARVLKPISNKDFKNINELRKYVLEAITNFRMAKGRGIIAQFDKDKFSPYLMFTRIGEGSVGGKARGLAFIDFFLKKYKLYSKYNDFRISIPRTVVIGTDYFDEFIEENDLYEIGISNKPDKEILEGFVSSKLSDELLENINKFLEITTNPIAIRSSSKLEDSYFQPFAGLYSTYMVPNLKQDIDKTVELVAQAIKCVYASVFFKTSKSYITATSNIIDEEKMGIILQEVCGTSDGKAFYPTISGVMRSINYYPIEPESPDDGIVNIAFGLGKTIVEGTDKTLRFSPKYPKKTIQLSDAEIALKNTQQNYYALNLDSKAFSPSIDDSINLLCLPISEAEKNNAFHYVGSVYDAENNAIVDGLYNKGRRIITFNSLLVYNTLPFTKIINDIIDISKSEMNSPVEIEFAVKLDVPDNEPRIFNILQIRPIVLNNQSLTFKIEKIDENEVIVYSDMALGNGEFTGLKDLILINDEKFALKESIAIAKEIEKLNLEFINAQKNYILIGSGRWGSSDPNLGIPVNWAQICNARIIVENSTNNIHIEPSQGTHFFQNITSFGVGYLTVNSLINEGIFNNGYLKSITPALKNDYLSHYTFDKELNTKINGRSNKGVIYKPGLK
ncbi:PEP/pyruvate-binding domain-containing protein [Bacteroidota bacterium]